MRVVLDPNVIISAIISRGVSHQLFDAWRLDQRYELVMCPALLDELGEVLARPRFRAAISPDELKVLLEVIANGSTVVDDPGDIQPVTRDPDDDYLIALATREQVDLLVSGDHDLTHAEITTTYQIVTPAQALALIE